MYTAYIPNLYLSSNNITILIIFLTPALRYSLFKII